MTAQTGPTDTAIYDAALSELAAQKDRWANLPVKDRLKLLRAVKKRTGQVAEGWAETAARKKGLPEGSPLASEEWLSGPYGLMRACDALIHTLRHMEGRRYLRDLPRRYLPNGQLAVQVMPADIWDRLLLSGITAEVWMAPGVGEATLQAHTASAYATPEGARDGKVALVLGAGNIASIAPLDCFHKLFHEHQVVLLKMNPVNAYLTDYLQIALKPLIDDGVLRIVQGGGAEGAYLTGHPLVDEIHITGAGSTHDAIVWGPGAEGLAAKAAGQPANPRRVTSELGAVCPTIVVPGPWSAADIQFQAEHIATMKLHNGGFNCVACQVLILPEDWAQKDALVTATRRVIAANTRPAYYPGTEERLEAFAGSGPADQVPRGTAPALRIAAHAPAHGRTEVFGPAMSVKELPGEGEAYLSAAIAFANDQLDGTLSANILIHPETIRTLGKRRFDALLSELRYGCIAVNAWTGVGFLQATVPWGAFPGHTLQDVQSGIGTVHYAFMFDRSERTIVRGPWAPFPRALRVGERSLLPKPPWFITHRNAAKVARGLTRFAADGKLWRLPGILLNALRS